MQGDAPTRWQRVIFHIDMDAFFASVEQRDNPELRGRPVVVGGSSARGVVAAASYEARRFGVHSAMPGFQARKLCPHAVFVTPRMSVYREVSATIMSVFHRYSPLVEPLSVDEAFLDMSGTEGLYGAPEDVALRIKREVYDAVALTASVGVGTSKLLAKVASSHQKPDGLTVVAPGEERRFLSPLPIGVIPGVGPKLQSKLEAIGVRRVGDVSEGRLAELQRLLGNRAHRFVETCYGRDAREVKAQRQRKSMSVERTLTKNITTGGALHRLQRALCEELARDLRRAGLKTRGVRVKIRYADFKTLTREKQLSHAVADSGSLLQAAEELVGRAGQLKPIRLVGVGATALVGAEDEAQPTLFDDAHEGREVAAEREKLEATIDAIANRFGDLALRRGSGGTTGGGPGHPWDATNLDDE